MAVSGPQRRVLAALAQWPTWTPTVCSRVMSVYVMPEYCETMDTNDGHMQPVTQILVTILILSQTTHCLVCQPPSGL